jgi:hypothetical protein
MASSRAVYAGAPEARNLPILVTGTTAISIATGSQATKTLAALGAGKRYICTSATFSLAASISLALSTIGVGIIDGASGASTFLWRGVMSVGSTGIQPLVVNGLWLVGSDNTALTVEFSAGVTSAAECVAIEYTTIGQAEPSIP